MHELIMTSTCLAIYKAKFKTINNKSWNNIHAHMLLMLVNGFLSCWFWKGLFINQIWTT